MPPVYKGRGLRPHTPMCRSTPFPKERGIIPIAPLQFDFERDEKDLHTFIKTNFVLTNTTINKIRIDKNNFIIIYNKWLEAVKPTIMVNWDNAKKHGIIAGDFYLADLLSRKNESLKDILYVYLKETLYLFNRHEDKELGTFNSSTAQFSDGQKAHRLFWEKYERPPLEEYWDYILQRRDLLVPQDIRERKGSFYTPKIWVELSQKYMADVFGVNWQDEYYVWDCAAGTGNLLAGLTNKDNIWASTLDKADIDVIYDRIHNGANLWEKQVFQFDFLNDELTKLPLELQDIIKTKPEKLIIYINPPYAECGYAEETGKQNKREVANTNRVHSQYTKVLGKASRELFAQFLIRIYKEIPSCKIGNFSTLKALCAPNFVNFRRVFISNLERLFIVPADTFDNVTGQFPIGFHIWDTSNHRVFEQIQADVYDKNGCYIRKKQMVNYDKYRLINDWIITYNQHTKGRGYKIANFAYNCNDFPHHQYTALYNIDNVQKSISNIAVTDANIIIVCIYFTVRKVIPADLLNHNDQFLYPNDNWQSDYEFQSDCLTYTLFHNKNNITCKHGINHWIPFTSDEVNAHYKFESHFMTDFMAGKNPLSLEGKGGLPEYAHRGGMGDYTTEGRPEIYATEGRIFPPCPQFFGEGALPPHPHVHESPLSPRGKGIFNGERLSSPITFSVQAQNVFDAGRELWRYYHRQKDCNVNASFYDIREYFQGRNEAGRMNSKSDDEMYNKLLGELRLAMRLLGEQIKPKIYEYGFLL